MLYTIFANLHQNLISWLIGASLSESNINGTAAHELYIMELDGTSEVPSSSDQNGYSIESMPSFSIQAQAHDQRI